MKSGIVTADKGFLHAIKRRSRKGALLVAVMGLALFSLAAATPASATNGSGVLLFSESFANNTVPTSEVVLPDLPSGNAQSPPSQACLTADGASSPSAVPECSDASDANGSGFLRFTNAADGEESGVFSATSLPSTQGLDVTFNSYQFGGGGADGIAFALAIANPSDPQPPAEIGESGGSLGYAPSAGHNGLSLGYLGVGLDAYGNYSTTGADGSDCATQDNPGGAQTPEAVSVRGPGNGDDGYCLVGGPWNNGNLHSETSTAVPVEVAINPTGSEITTASGLDVLPASYAVQWTPVDGTKQTESGDLPDLTDAKYSDLDIPPTDYNSSGIPYQMTFGWVASTGGVTDTHEIQNVVVDSGTSNVAPTMGLSASDSAGGEFGQGTSVGYTFTPTVSSTDESGTITFTDPFPTGLTPTSTAGTDVSWSCTTTSTTVTCTHAGVAAGTTMPNIDIAANVASNASTTADALDDRGYVSANDALDADALDQATAYGPATATSLSPNTGSMTGNTQVAVTGTNFLNVASVNVGSATVSNVCGSNGPFSDCYSVNSATSITLYTPSGVSAGGVGPHPLTVTNDAGTGSGSTYTYTKATSTTTVTSSQNPSVSGQAVSFTANLTSGATGTVTFTITPGVTCTGGDVVAVTASSATCSVPAATLTAVNSPYTVSANYSGDVNNSSSTGTLDPSQTVNQDSTTSSTPTSTVNPSIYGQTVTFATTVSAASPGAGTPTGVAQFEETVGGNTTTLCAGTLNDAGQTSCASNVMPVGTASIQATYLGDSNFLTSTSTGLIQFVDQSSTTTVLSSNLNPSGFGKPVTFTATVGATAPGSGTPVGQVSFSADGNAIAGCSNVALNGSAQAQCTTSALSVAGHTVVAAYGGNVDYLSSSGSLTQVVNQEVTTTNEVSSANPAVTGQSVSITANVSYTGSGTPTGNVTFTITPESGLAPQCAGGNIVALSSSASAVCTLTLSAGSAPYGIQAEYSGDANYDTSSSSVLTENVSVASTTTSVSTSAPGAVTDQAITFTASVGAVAPGGGVPSDGTVGFDIGGAPVAGCGARTVTAGTATCTVSDLDVVGGPTYSVTAFYSGAPDYASSNNSETPLIQTIAPDATTTSVGSNTNPSTFGQSVTFTATVSANAPGSGTPTGSATISADGSPLCTGVLGEAGQLSCSTSTLAAGTHQITATYSATTDYSASTSSTLTQGVNQSATTTAVSSSDNPSAFGESVTITATVSAVAPGQGTPTGFVDFSNGINPICVNVPLAGGVATCAINYPIGSYNIVAAYRGSIGFAQSSGQLTQVVQKAATITTVVSAPTVVTGQSATYQAETTVAEPGSTQLAALSGTISLFARDTQLDAQVLLCSTNVGLSGATVSCSSSHDVASGSPWSITAVYSGDANFATSTSTAVAQTVNLAATSIGVTAVVNPAVTGQSILVSAGFSITSPGSDSPVAPTGSVEFEVSLDGGTSFSPISGCDAQPTTWSTTNHAGSATCTLPSPPAVSSVELKGIYSGDTNFGGSTSQPITVVVNLAATTTTVSVDTNPSVTGEGINFTGTVAVAPPGSDSTPPTGTVEFEYSTTNGIVWNDITGCGAAPLTWNPTLHTGTAPCATSFAATSTGVEVQAVYSGDGNFDGSTSATPVTQVVNEAQTTTSVILAPQNTVSGQTVTATAGLLIAAPGSDSPSAPSGAVDFQYSTNDGDTWSDIAGCSTQPLAWNSETHRGSSACTTSFAAGSSPVEVQAVYSGDLNFNLSTSPSATETILPAGTTTSVTVVPDTSVSGQAVGISATVSITAPGSDTPSAPSGTVDFQTSTNDGDTWSNIADCATQAFTWNSTTHTGTSLCTTAFAATSSGIEIQAVYSGDTNFTTSTSQTASQTVNPASTTTSVTAVVDPSVTGQDITATAAFAVTSPGSDSPVAPTGNVEFKISLNGGTSFSIVSGCATQPTTWDEETHAGSATCTLPSPPAVSTVELEGIYSGDDNFTTSTSPPVDQTVNKASTSTGIAADTNPSISGQTVNYTATVAVTPPGTDNPNPTGTVEFQYSTNGGDDWTNVTGCTTAPLTWNPTLHTGTAPCATSFAATSTGVEVQAVYSGDGNFDGSTSATPVTQVVNEAQTTTSVILAPQNTVSGQTVTATAGLLIAAPGSDSPSAPSGAVDFQYSTNDGDTWSDIAGCSTQPLAWNSETHRGSSACTTSFAAGSSPVEVQAVYSGDLNFNLSTSPSATETILPAGTTTSVTVVPDTSVSGQAVGISATVSITAPGSDTPSAPSGTVDFQTSTNDGDTWSNIADCATQAFTWNSTTHTGTSLCTTAFAATSSGIEIQAVYSGDTNFTTSTSQTASQTVNPASTTTSVTAVVDPSVTGQDITATAAFAVTSPGSDSPVAPTGNVEFKISLNGGTSFSIVSGCATQPTTWDEETHAGSATCTLPSPPAVSTVELEGIYSGDDNFTTSTSPPVDQTVNKASTSTGIAADTNPSISGQTVNYTATVAVTPPGTDNPNPTGTVEFQYSTNGGDDWTNVANCETQTLVWDSVNHTGVSTCAAAFAKASSGDEVHAVYSGDLNFTGSPSTALTQTVTAAPTTSAVVLSSSNTVSGQAFTASATVLITAPGSDSPSAPTGTVLFQYSANDGVSWTSIPSCAPQALTWASHAGTASCVAEFDAGSSPVLIRAVYSGDVNFITSISPSQTETVSQVSTTTSMTATPGAAVSGQSIELSASVLISEPGSDLPAGASGPVDFEYSTNSGGTWTSISGCATEPLAWDSTSHVGSSSCTTAFLATSSGVEMRAVYTGDADFTGSNSSATTETVGPASTAIGVNTSANPSVNGQIVTVNATVTVDAPGGDVPSGPTGTVEFESSTDHGATWAAVAACSAQALVWSGSLHQGAAGCTGQFGVSQSGIQFKAVYSGSSNFTTSLSSPVTQTVGRSLTSTVVTSSPDSSGPLQAVTFVARVSVLAPGTGTLSGSVSFRDGSTALCGVLPLTASHTATCTSHLSITAAQSVVAVYTGNALSSGSTGSMVQNVRHGYWLLGADGGVFSYGDAQFYGSLPQIGYTPAGSGGPHQLKAPLVGITSTVSGQGYWLVASDGGVFSFGDAVFYGSTGSMHLNKPIVAMATTPDGKGYWLIASDGGVFAFGDAKFYGSTGAMHLNKPIVAAVATTDGKGYWMVASDGGIFAFGDAHYHGSPATSAIPEPAVGMVRTTDNGGYWIASASGHVYSYGDAGVASADAPTNSPVVGMSGTADGKGYWMSTASGGVFTFGDAIFDGSASTMTLQRPIVGMSGL